MSVRLGTRALTSRMILGLAPASKDSSVTLNIVFSLTFSYTDLSDLQTLVIYQDYLPPVQLPRQQQPRVLLMQLASQFLEC